MELAGKVALVTGAARRLGRGIALALGRSGADVIVHYGRSQGQAEAVVEQLRALSVRSEALQADLAKPEQIEKMFAAAGERFGRLDVLVNNAAVFQATPIEALTAEQWDTELAVNARAPALCIRHAAALMPDGGAIVNITDIGAERPWPTHPAYCASKAALTALTKSAAKALAARNIRVNAVAPGAILWPEGLPERTRRRLLAQVPLKRAGSVEDIASAVVFLARNDYVTGQTLNVDGGRSIA